MAFSNVGNNLVKLPVASHASGSTSLVLAIAGDALPAAPFRLTCVTGPTYGTATESLTIYSVSAVATDTPAAGQCTLTVSPAEGTADQAYSSSDFAEVRLTAGTIQDLNSAVSTAQAAIAALQAAGYVTAAGAAAAAPVQAVAGRTGDVVLAESDITGLAADLAALAPLASPALTGTPTAPTPATADSSTTVATTGFVKAQGYVTSSGAAAAAPVQTVAGRTGAVTLAESDITGLVADLATRAPLASPAFTGTINLAPIADPGSPSAGDLWMSSPSAGPSCAPAAGWPGRIGRRIYAGTGFAPVANTTSNLSLLSSPTWSDGSLTIPAGAIVPGNCLAILGAFDVTQGSGSITLQITLGGTAVLATGTGWAPVITDGIGVFNVPPHLFFTAVGASGKVTGAGHMIAYFANGSGNSQPLMPPSASGLGVSINTNVALSIDLRCQFSAASAGNVMTATAFEVFLW